MQYFIHCNKLIIHQNGPSPYSWFTLARIPKFELSAGHYSLKFLSTAVICVYSSMGREKRWVSRQQDSPPSTLVCGVGEVTSQISYLCTVVWSSHPPQPSWVSLMRVTLRGRANHSGSRTWQLWPEVSCLVLVSSAINTRASRLIEYLWGELGNL